MPLVRKLVRLAGNAPAHYKQATRAVNNTPLSKAATISLQIFDQKDIYTSGDQIEGVAILELSEQVDIAEITLKYKVDEITCIRHPKGAGRYESESAQDEVIHDRRTLKLKQRYERRKLRAEQRQDRVNRDAVYRGFTKLHCQEQRIFPSEHEHAAIQAKKLTLAPGAHRFSFSIRLPGHEGDNYKILPPSFSDGTTADISHMLKVTVKRASVFKQNIRCEAPIKFSPAANRQASDIAHIITKTEPLSTVCATAAVPFAAQVGSTFPINLGVSSSDGELLRVVEIVGEIVSQITTRANSFTKRNQQSHVFVTKHGLANSSAHLDLSELLQDNTIPKSLVPSFQSRYVTLNHAIKITIRFATGSSPTRSITLERSIAVMGAQSFAAAPSLSVHNAVYDYPQDSSSFLSETARSCSVEEKSSFSDSQAWQDDEKSLSYGLPPCYT